MISKHLDILWVLVCPQLFGLWVDGLGSAGPGVAEVLVVRSACGREQKRVIGFLHGPPVGKASHKHLEFWSWEQPVQCWLATHSCPRESSPDFVCLGPPIVREGGEQCLTLLVIILIIGQGLVLALLHLLCCFTKGGHLVWRDEKPHGLYLDPSSMITSQASEII